ncbi:MAG: fibronectin type III domain-containing protein [Erysipelotrichaceae bacterium]|nr:fibronectin type III domain-containing protein [Erysipelotrichaceae bacterium]
MKKFVTLLLSLALILSLSMTSLMAYETGTLDQAYDLTRSYFQSKNRLTSMDEVISYESLNLEAEDMSEVYAISSNDIYSAGSTAKAVVTISLLGQNPNNYNGTNYVTMLEDYVNDDGSVTGTFGANEDIWVIYGLYVVDSKELDTAVDHFVATYKAEDLNYYESTWGEYTFTGHDLDTTGWAIAGLSLVNKTAYKDYIETSISGMKSLSADNADGSYADPYNGNTDTQASVLQGLLSYDHEGVLNDAYNINDINPFAYLLSFQLSDGSFGYGNTTETNAYATLDGARALGVYKNGHFLDKAKDSYEDAQALSVNLSTSIYTYNGKKKTPGVSVSVKGKTLTKGTDFTVKYASGRKKVGTYKITVTFINDYADLDDYILTMTIKPKKVTIKSIKKYKKKLTVKYKSAGKTVKYQIAYRKKGTSKWKYIKTKKLSYKIKKLKRKTNYQVKVRAYKGSIKGAWSKTKTVKTK